jgi:hypothetical protein
MGYCLTQKAKGCCTKRNRKKIIRKERKVKIVSCRKLIRLDCFKR